MTEPGPRVGGAGESDASEVSRLGRQVSNAGRWGDDDERGTANLVTPEAIVAAARLVRSGRVVPVGRTIEFEASPANPRPGVHRMLFHHDADNVAADMVTLACHGFSMTHMDAPAHVAFEGTTYNDRRLEDVVSEEGLSFGSILALGSGIVSRGVLLDVPSALGRPWMDRGEWVTAADLEAAEAHQGVRVGRGDVLCLRVGLDAREAETGPLGPELRTGLDVGAVEWMHERGVAAFGGDCIERLPSEVDGCPLPLHMLGMARMGLVLIDHLAVEDLGAACAEEGRWEFLFVVSPLRVPRATGSPVNPVCIF